MHLTFLMALLSMGCSYDCKPAYEDLISSWKIAVHGVGQEVRTNQEAYRELVTSAGACEVSGCPELDARNFKVELANLNTRQEHLQELHGELNAIGRSLVERNLASVRTQLPVLAGYLALELAESGQPLHGLEHQTTRYLDECP